MIQDLLGIRITRYSNCCAGQSILKMPRTPAGFRPGADARTPLAEPGDQGRQATACAGPATRSVENVSRVAVRGGQFPTLLKNIHFLLS